MKCLFLNEANVLWTLKLHCCQSSRRTSFMVALAFVQHWSSIYRDLDLDRDFCSQIDQSLKVILEIMDVLCTKNHQWRKVCRVDHHAFIQLAYLSGKALHISARQRCKLCNSVVQKEKSLKSRPLTSSKPADVIKFRTTRVPKICTILHLLYVPVQNWVVRFAGWQNQQLLFQNYLFREFMITNTSICLALESDPVMEMPFSQLYLPLMMMCYMMTHQIPVKPAL